MVQLEKRLLWHPRKENKFLVGEHSQIILYEWASEHPEIRHVTSQHDLHSMKCFAWSPDPAFDDLIAVGLSTGKVDLIRLEASKQSRRKNTLSSGPSATLPIRTPRTCNALAFSNANPNYLAVGLEKVRGDSGIIIWDIINVLPSLRIPHFESGEDSVINNPSAVHSRPLPQIPRIESHIRNDPRVLQQHATAETVCSLAFLPSSAHLLLSNISNRYLRLFDLRAPSIPPSNLATKLHGIAVDSFDAHRVASFGDSTVTIWDIRKFSQPIMTFSERDALADGARSKQGSGYINIEFSSTRRGTIATMEKESSYVRFWELSESRVSALEGSLVGGGSSDGETNKSSKETNRGARRSWANLPWPGGGEKDRSQHHSHQTKEGDLTSSLELLPQQTFVLSNTHRTKYFRRPLASFALVPNSIPGNPHPLTSNVMVVNKDGDLELYAIHDTPKQLAWSARGDLALGAGLGLKVLEGYQEANNDGEDDEFVPEEPKQMRSSRDRGSRGRDNSMPRMSERGRTSRSPSASHRSASFTRGRRQGASRRDGYASLPALSLSTIPSPSATPTLPASTLFREDEVGLSNTTPDTPSTATLSKPTGLSATRPRDAKRSPAKVGKHSRAVEGGEERQSEKRDQKKRSLSRTDTIPADDADSEYDGKSVGTSRGRSKRGDGVQAKSTSRPRNVRAREVGKKPKEAGVVGLIREDISMVIRGRVKEGYGLSQLQHNMLVISDIEPEEGANQALSEFWAWLYHSQEIFSMPTARIHGYDFSYQGLLSLWEGLALMPVSVQPALVGDPPMTMQQSLLLDIPPIANPLYPAYVQTHAPTTSIGNTGSIPAGPTVGGLASNISQLRGRSPDGLHGNWPAALAALAARRGSDTTRSSWKPAVHTSKLLQRQIALQVIGWSLRDNELGDAIKRWQKEGQFARAACWLVFTKNYGKAVELLMRSDDETHQMMSGTIAALAPLMSSTGSARGFEIREIYGRLIIRLNDPYFRMLLTHLSTNEWSEVLDEDVIPFRERLAIALQFLDDKALSSYLRRLTEEACEHGSIEGLILTGLTPSGMRVIQSYVDHTGDVQSAAILSSYVCPHRFKDKRAERWLESYRDLLDGFRLHHLRVGFDIERGQILLEAQQNGSEVDAWAPKQIMIRCYYCNKAVDGPALLVGQQPQKGRPTQCTSCSRELPRCAVCLMTLSIMGDAAREVSLGSTQSRDTFDDAIVICQTCRHGGHANHILEWFLGEDGQRTHSICPVAECNCRCADE